jgi:hypothetical protein
MKAKIIQGIVAETDPIKTADKEKTTDVLLFSANKSVYEKKRRR